MARNQSEETFFEILKAIGYFIAALAALIGFIFESIVRAGRHAFRRADENATIRKLEVRYDTNQVYEQNVQLARATGFPDVSEFMESFYDRFIDQCDDLEIIPAQPVRGALLKAAGRIYGAEGLAAPLAKPSGLGPIEEARYRDQLMARMRKQSNPQTLPLIHRALLDSQLALAKCLPTLAYQDPNEDGEEENKPQANMTVPLIDVMPNVGNAVYEMILPLFHPDAIEAGLFADLRSQLERNQDQASASSRNRVINPQDYDGTPSEIVHAYLKHTPLEAIFAPTIKFEIPDQIRFEHAVVFGGAGAGKTQFLSRLLMNDLQKPNPPAVVIIDPHGDFLKEVQRLQLFAPGQPLSDRLVILDPEQFSPALNMFSTQNTRLSGYADNIREQVEASTIETFTYIFAGLAQELTGPQSTAFSYVARLMLSIDGATIHDLLALMEEDPKSIGQSRFAEHIGKMDQTSKSFFENQFFTKSMSQTKNGIARRLYGVLQVPAFNRMFGADENRLDMFDILQSGKICLVHTAKNLLKEDASSLFGRYVVAQVLHAAFERVALPPSQRRPAYLLIDEAGEFCDPLFDSLLREVRKFRLGVTLAFQYIDQLPSSIRASVFSNTAIKLAAQVSDKDARALAPDMRTTHDFISSMKKSRTSTEFACYVRNYTDHAIRLEIPFGTLEHAAKMTDAQHKVLVERNRARYAADPAQARPAAAGPDTPPSSTPAGDDWRS